MTARGTLDGTFTTSLDPAARTTHLADAYVRDNIAIVPGRFDIAPGAKLEWNSYTGLEVQPDVRFRWLPATQDRTYSGLRSRVRCALRRGSTPIVRFIAGGFHDTAHLPARAGRPDFISERLIETVWATVPSSRRRSRWTCRLLRLVPRSPLIDARRPALRERHVVPAGHHQYGRAHTAGGTAAVGWRRCRRSSCAPATHSWPSTTRWSPTPRSARRQPEYRPEPEAPGGSPALRLPAGQLPLAVVGRYVSPLRDRESGPTASRTRALAWSPTPLLSIAVAGYDLLQRRRAEFAGGHYVPRRGELQSRGDFVAGARAASRPDRLAAAMSLLLLAARGAAAQAPRSEYEVKAAYLLNFARYAEWPASPPADATDDLVICVLGRDPFGAALDPDRRGPFPRARAPSAGTAPGEPRGGAALPARVHRRADRTPRRTLLAEMRGRPVLTIGDGPTSPRPAAPLPSCQRRADGALRGQPQRPRALGRAQLARDGARHRVTAGGRR